MKSLNIPRFSRNERGFALVVTLSLMILLTVIAVGLLTLSSISLRSSSQGQAMATARANARMALLLAIGELQKSTGPDQRVTSTANIAGDAAGSPLAAGAQPLNDKSINGDSKGLSGVRPGSRYWTGVWKNSNSTTQGVDIYSKTPSPTFVQWLVSGNEGNGPAILPSDSNYSANTSGAVTDIKKAVVLVGKSTVGSSTDSIENHVVVPLIQVIDKDPSKPVGRYGWWVGDEGVKAKINISKTLENKSNYASLVAQRRGWETVSGFNDPSGPYPTPSSAQHALLPKIISLSEARLLLPGLGTESGGSSPIQSVFHSATTDSKALLIDSLNGGMKLDLTAILAGDLPTSNPVTSIPNYPVKDSNVIPAKINSLDTIAVKMKAPRWDAIKNFHDRFKQLDGGSMVVKPATSEFVSSVSPIITDFRILMGVRLKVKDATARTFFITPCGKIAVAIANPYSYPLKWNTAIEIEIRNQTPTGNDPSRIWGNISPKPAYLPKEPYPASTEAAVFNNAIFSIPVASLAPGEARAYTMSSPVKRPAGSASPVTVNLTPFSSSSPFDFNNCIELDNTSVYNLLPAKPSDPPKRFELDVRESWQTSLANIEMSLAGSGSGNRLLRRIERFELDNGYFSPNQRKFYNRRADGTALGDQEPVAVNEMTQPFPLMLYSFQISQPGGPYKDYMPSTYDLGQRGSTLRTFADFNLQATRIRKPIASYNPPPYFAESNDNAAQLAAKPPGGDTGTAFTRDFGLVARWGRSSKSGSSEKTILFSVPSQYSSLAQLQHADITGDDIGASIGHQPGNAVGNSYASPFVKRGLTTELRASYELKGSPDKSGTNPIYPTSYYDLSYLLNTALWDSYFFSSVPRSGAAVPENPTLVRFNPNDTSSDIKDATGLAVAPLLFIDGGFNINSTDKTAWKAFLASAKHFKHAADTTTSTDAAFPRGLAQTSPAAVPPSGENADSFTGFRRLTDPQLDALAEEMVKQVRLRGPFLSISHFVNRALAPITNQPALSRSGALQTAIDESGANISFQGKKNVFAGTTFKSTDDVVTLGWKDGAPRADFDGGKTINRPNNPDYAKSSTDQNYGSVASIYSDREMLSDAALTPEQGFRSTGIPGWVTQADVLQVIGSSITARSDTFRIRAFGEALDASGKSVAKAYCEAVIQRMPAYVDPSNPPTARDAGGTTLSNINKIYGRQYQIVSFRWLSPQEI